MKVELLTPAGSYDSVFAALNAGADAVYTGGELFGARAAADNLTAEQFADALDYAHIHNKKIYLTVNTLLKDRELEEQLYDLIAPLYENGLDAVIVQDIGVLKFIREYFSELPIHASTQMTVFGKETGEALKQLGVTRIVTPREMSLTEIRDISSIPEMEIESFVHGALCYCYSGQCFLSSYIGGRSGNRGRCAQPCRMPYDVLYQNRVVNPGNQKYVLSPKDICTLNILPRIIEAGVFSLKIEGRMKKPEYVAGVTEIYRKYINLYLENPQNYRVESSDMDRLSDLFQRNGFHESYYNQHNGRNMISLKKPEFRKENKEYTDYLKKTYIGKKLKRKIDMNVVCVAGSPLQLSSVIDGCFVSVQGDVPDKAQNRPIDAKTLEKQLKKTGNTDFSIHHMNIQMAQDLFVPIADLNELRRRFLEQVQESILIKHRRSLKHNFKPYCEQEKKTEREFLDITPEFRALVWNFEQFQEVIQHDFVQTIYLECTEMTIDELTRAVRQGKKAGKQIYLAMPYVFRKKDKEFFDKNLLSFVQYTEELTGILIRNPEEYFHLINCGVEKKYIFDYNVYAYNKPAKKYYSHCAGEKQDRKNGKETVFSYGENKTTVPLELNLGELKMRGCGGEEIIIYGYMPAMISAGCCLKTCNLCNKNKNSVYQMKDRLGNCFPTRCVCSYCYNIMYNCKPLSLFKYGSDIQTLHPDSVRLSFTLESRKEIRAILERAEQTFTAGGSVGEDDKSTRGHFKRGVL